MEAQDFENRGRREEYGSPGAKTIDELRQIPAPDVKGAEQFKNIYLDYFRVYQKHVYSIQKLRKCRF